MNHTPFNHQLSQILQSSFINDKPQYKNIVSEKQMNQLVKKTFIASEEQKNICCPISMISFENGQEVTALPCGHIFDSESIKTWVTTEKASCPVCRYNLIQYK